MKKVARKTPLFNLEKWISQVENEKRVERKQSTLAYQVPYQMAKGLKMKAETGRHFPGTFFKIVSN